MTNFSPSSLPPRVPLLDVVRSNESLHEQILQALAGVLSSGRFLYGDDVAQLEASIAQRLNVRHAIGCASGSDALLLSLMALNVGRGDEVIVPSFTFFATASAAWRLGAKIVFCDIDPVTFNMDPRHVESLITGRTRAIIPVHLFGQCAAMDDLVRIARSHNVAVIEDAAQALGARFNGQAAGAMGDVGCFSFYPTKNLGGCGDGGMLTTDRDDMQQQLRLLAAHGMSPRYLHKVVGINSRLDSFQAAALNVKLEHLDVWTMARQANASRYKTLFEEAGLDETIGLPATDSRCDHVWNQYTIRVPGGRRDALRQHLADHGVGTEIYYPCPLHLQECFASLGYTRGSLPATEEAADEVLSLPIFPGLTAVEQQAVVHHIGAFFKKARQSSAA